MSYIKINNLSKIYEEGEYKFYALKNINVEFNKNEFISIIGPSGCGKSTLLNLIAGISDISKGDIFVNNKSLKKYNKRELNKYLNSEIGFIFQKYNLINLYNVIENIDLVRNRNVDSNSSNILLEEFNLLKLKDKNIKEISGGEAQRIATLRSIINRPSILLLDEPTGALDEENSKILLDYITSIRKDKLIIMVTHNLELAKKYSTRIIELKDGKIIKDINNINVISNNNIIKNESNHYLKIKYIIIYIKNLIVRKKGRFIISILCSIFLLFFLSISFMGGNVVKNYIESTFLSSLDANVIDLKSYHLIDKNLIEVEVPPIILNQINNDDDYIIRKNLNSYLNKNLMSKLLFINNNKNINLNGIQLLCMSIYQNENIKFGSLPKQVNEVIINENLYKYLGIDNIINKRFEFKDENEYLKITGVSSSPFMNDSLIIYFDYNLLSSYLENEEINSYQIDIKNINNIDIIINKLKENYSYKEKENIKNNELNFSLKYSVDLENYYTFYDLIKVVKVVVILFLGIASLISVMLFSNVLYSFNEEEKKNLAILKVLGFSNLNIGLINLFLSIIVSLISFFIIIIINKYINSYFSDRLSNFLKLDNNINLKLSFSNNLIILITIMIIAFISSIYPLFKLKNIKIDNVLKEE